MGIFEDMDRAVMRLALELPETVWNDVKKKWDAVKLEKDEKVAYAKEWRRTHKKNVLEANRRYMAKHKIRESIRHKKYYQENKKKVNDVHNTYMRNKKRKRSALYKEHLIAHRKTNHDDTKEE